MSCFDDRHTEISLRWTSTLDMMGGTLPIGTSIQVDLALEPCMVRIGDGRDDLTSIRVISKGSVIGFV